MSKLSPLKPDEVVGKLRKLGFIGPIPGGKHARMFHPESVRSFRFQYIRGKPTHDC